MTFSKVVEVMNESERKKMLWFCSNNFSASSSSYSNRLPYQSLIDSNNNNDEDEKNKNRRLFCLF